MPNEHLVATIRAAIEWAALGIEILGAVVIVAGGSNVALVLALQNAAGSGSGPLAASFWESMTYAGDTRANAGHHHLLVDVKEPIEANVPPVARICSAPIRCAPSTR